MLFIETNHWGYVITSDFGEKEKFVGFMKNEAIQRYADTYETSVDEIMVIEI